jgi:hypothetical protein
MSKDKCPVGSRWQRSQDRILKVIGKRPFGIIELMEEGKARFIDMRQQDLLATHGRVNAAQPCIRHQPERL